MPNCCRILFENCYYHVMVRGNQKQNIFLQESDYEKYFGLLKHYKRKFHFKMYAWCLMPNHVHVILDFDDPKNLTKMMQGFNIAYVRWFNKKYGKVGHLWQGRFKSMLIQKDKYVLDCINYIEMNPVRAKITKAPVDYIWSSARARILGEKCAILDLPKL